jgi:hypothetical protein
MDLNQMKWMLHQRITLECSSWLLNVPKIMNQMEWTLIKGNLNQIESTLINSFTRMDLVMILVFFWLEQTSFDRLHDFAPCLSISHDDWTFERMILLESQIQISPTFFLKTIFIIFLSMMNKMWFQHSINIIQFHVKKKRKKEFLEWNAYLINQKEICLFW